MIWVDRTPEKMARSVVPLADPQAIQMLATMCQEMGFTGFNYAEMQKVNKAQLKEDRRNAHNLYGWEPEESEEDEEDGEA